jgi:HEAT repeat protein
MLIFDDGNASHKRLSFDQPTPWLAMQLERDPNVWNRHWLIAQLSDRTKDEAAGVALAKAATTADYFLVRAAAAAALVQFPTTIALPALQAAVTDTSAQVRAAAVEALGSVGGAEAAALAKAAWSRDSSAAVRAAAVTAMALTDSANRRAIVLEALRTPSYRDAIQNGAYRVIAQTGDTSLVDTVEARVGRDHFAVHVLAALAARGSSRALDLLVRHLDDDRSYVRNWTVEAFRYSLPRPIAQPKLQAVSASLKFADTREAVADLLKSWATGG